MLPRGTVSLPVFWTDSEVSGEWEAADWIRGTMVERELERKASEEMGHVSFE